MEAFDKHLAAVPARPVGLVWLHWLTLLPLILAFAAVLLRGQVEERGLRAALLWIHQCSGATVMALCVLRLGVRWKVRPLPHVVASRWSNGLAEAVHCGLYLAMLVVPLLGWGFATASGHLPPWGLGLPGVAVDEDLADRMGEWHESAAYAWLLVIGLHGGAALWHHFVLRDGVLTAMRLRRAPRFPADPTPPA